MVKKKRLAGVFRWTYRLTLLALVVVVALVGFAYWQLSGSLAQLNGEVRHPILLSSVEVARDAQGIPVIVANERPDAAFALGYLHAQERYFQMDLQ